MKHFYILLLYLINSTCIISSSQQTLTIKNLNPRDQSEVVGTCNLFKDPTIQHKTGGKNPYCVQQEIMQGDRFIICKSPNGSVYGALKLNEDLQDRVAEVETVAVAPGYRNKGIGSALLQVAQNSLHPSTRLIHLKVQYSNPAIKFYRQHGYVEDPCTKCKAIFWSSVLSVVPCINTSDFSVGMVKNIKRDDL